MSTRPSLGMAARTPLGRATPNERSAVAAAAAAERAAAPPGGPPSSGMAARTPVHRATAPRRLRNAMGRFATGVTVITTADDEREQVHGMTANGVLSVSLDPPLVLVSLGRCRMAEMLPRTGRYGISVLAERQEHIAAHFAGQATSDELPAFDWRHGLPFVPDTLAHLGCRVAEIHQAGDHWLWIGRVEHMEHWDGEPLLFYSGRFCGLSPRAAR